MDLEQTVSPEEIGLAPEDVKPLTPIRITALLERVGETVIAKANVKMRISFFCARCLEEVSYDHVLDCNFDYQIESEAQVIDFGDDIRQEIILGLPTRILCKEECEGIRAGCGINLNLEKCQCRKQNV